jgi:uncharacterized SAM-binding protein YcdF (DUF218 family)
LVSGCGDASVNRDLLVALGVPQTAISMEPRSHSTLENARYAAPLLRKAGARKVAIVTSWYHSSRAYATFCHEAPDLTFISLPVASQVDKAPYEQSCQRWELLKKVWYLVRYGVPL